MSLKPLLTRLLKQAQSRVGGVAIEHIDDGSSPSKLDMQVVYIAYRGYRDDFAVPNKTLEDLSEEDNIQSLVDKLQDFRGDIDGHFRHVHDEAKKIEFRIRQEFHKYVSLFEESIGFEKGRYILSWSYKNRPLINVSIAHAQIDEDATWAELFTEVLNAIK